MAIVKSFSVGNGDMCYVQHNSDNFSIIDCDISSENQQRIISEIKEKSASKRITRFICTHPDDDHFGGIEHLDAALGISNFYVVRNKAIKSHETQSFKHYCRLRDDENKAFYIYKNCKRKWATHGDDDRGSSGLEFLWPDTENTHFKSALFEAEIGLSYNNTSAVIRYSIINGPSFLWIGDLETDFMENISNNIELNKTTIVFASHHGRESGKIPDSWLERLDPQIIIIGEAPSRHLNYYTGYKTITQNRCGDITMECEGNKVHFYSSNDNYVNTHLDDEQKNTFSNYIGTITVETEYTIE
ncbi:TPA: hypothetical protein ACQZHW_001492 [Enterobacter hormaechei]